MRLGKGYRNHMLSKLLTIRTKSKSLYTSSSNIGLMMVEKKMMDEQKFDLQNQTDFFFHRSTSILSVYPHRSWLTPLFSLIINILNECTNLEHVVGTRGSYKNPSWTGALHLKY